MRFLLPAAVLAALGSILPSAQAQCSLSTIFTGGNGLGANSVCYFDLNASQPFLVQSLDVNTSTTVGNPVTIELYTRSGTYVGATSSSAGWTLRGAGTGFAAAQFTPTTCTFPAPILFTPGISGMCVRFINLTNRYTNGNGTNQFFSNAFYSLTLGQSAGSAFTGGTINNRVWNGRINCVPAVGLFASFSATPTSGASPLTVNFTDTTFSSDPGGVTSWAWDFNGDSFIDSNAQNPSFVYTTCGRYSVSLTVTDAANPTATVTRSNLITVDPALLVSSNWTATPTVGQVPLTVNFTDTSTGTPTAWAWDFDGDNVVDSNAQNPSYIYTTPGSYNVTLTASNACGASSVTRVGFVACVANDECTTAVSLNIGLNGPFTSVGSTTSAPAWPCAGGGNDVWYSYTASQNATVEVNLCTGTNYDSAVQALVGDCAGTLVSVACNDDSCTLASRITFPACRNATVLIRVGGFNGARGNFSLEVIETPNTAGSHTVLGTTCGGPTLTATGLPQLGEQLSYAMSGGVAIPFLVFGFTTFNGPLCTAGCILGPNPEFAVYARSLSATVPCDRNAIGVTIYFQGLDLGALTGCGPLDPLLVATTETIATVIG